MYSERRLEGSKIVFEATSEEEYAKIVKLLTPVDAYTTFVPAMDALDSANTLCLGIVARLGGDAYNKVLTKTDEYCDKIADFLNGLSKDILTEEFPLEILALIRALARILIETHTVAHNGLSSLIKQILQEEGGVEVE